jgi:hypothetical protein
VCFAKVPDGRRGWGKTKELASKAETSSGVKKEALT